MACVQDSTGAAFLLGLEGMENWADKGQTPFTLPVSIHFALDAALDLLHAEGMPAVYARREKLAHLSRTRALALGFKLFPDPRYASPTVTALYPPAGFEANDLVRRARDEMDVEFADARGELKGRIIRIGHLGWVHEPEIDHALDALQALVSSPAYVEALTRERVSGTTG